MKNKLFIIILSVLLILFTGCSKEAASNKASEEVPEKTEENEPAIEKEIDKTEETEPDESNKAISPLDGLKYNPEELNKRPVAVSIDNHPDARWQSGLKDAEIVYEFEVEFPYTRYLAVFLSKAPELVGPVRSARPYIIYYAFENDAIFVHVGGSEDAFSEIERLKIADIDGLYSSAMYRYNKTGKFVPHNMYTTLQSIRNESEIKGYRTEGNFTGYKFNEKSSLLSDKYNCNTAEEVNITYNKQNTTYYKYDSDKKIYLRFKDGEEHIDELNKEQLAAKNIIILEAPKKVLDSKGRLYLESIGKGKGIYITNGEAVDIIWKKESEKDRTKFYVNKDDLPFNPGNTWIQVVNSAECVTIN